MRRTIPILAIVTWLGAILIITRGPFSVVTWFMGQFDPTFLIYNICGIILAALVFFRGYRWARVASFALALPAGLWALLGVFTLLGFLLPAGEEQRPDSLLYLWICFVIVVLMICMPVLWAMLCFGRLRSH